MIEIVLTRVFGDPPKMPLDRKYESVACKVFLSFYHQGSCFLPAHPVGFKKIKWQ
jgi:hypothetical protein